MTNCILNRPIFKIRNLLQSGRGKPQREDNGKLLENAVFLYLGRNLRIQEELRYYKGKK